jgi:hypothetical protein
MARNPFTITKGNNYLTRRIPKAPMAARRSADVLQVGNGLVVFRVVEGDVPTDEIKVVTETNFRRAYTDEDVETELLGARSAKKTILKANPEAAAAW